MKYSLIKHLAGDFFLWMMILSAYYHTSFSGNGKIVGFVLNKQRKNEKANKRSADVVILDQHKDSFIFVDSKNVREVKRKNANSAKLIRGLMSQNESV